MRVQTPGPRIREATRPSVLREGAAYTRAGAATQGAGGPVVAPGAAFGQGRPPSAGRSAAYRLRGLSRSGSFSPTKPPNGNFLCGGESSKWIVPPARESRPDSREAAQRGILRRRGQRFHRPSLPRAPEAGRPSWVEQRPGVWRSHHPEGPAGAKGRRGRRNTGPSGTRRAALACWRHRRAEGKCRRFCVAAGSWWSKMRG